jgi:hypothetical protein
LREPRDHKISDNKAAQDKIVPRTFVVTKSLAENRVIFSRLCASSDVLRSEFRLLLISA